MRKLLLQICKRIEELNPGCIAYAYNDGLWWMVAVNDYEFYTKDLQFLKLCNNWHKVFNAKKQKLVFCYCNPNEKMLNKLAQSDNLIMNV